MPNPNQFVPPGARSLSRGAASLGRERELFALDDALMAIPRGVEGAFHDLYGLADYVTGDNLPDWDQRILGESRTTVGGLVEGVSNFLTGFIPIVGPGAWVGKAAAAGRMGKYLASASRLNARIAKIKAAPFMSEGFKAQRIADLTGRAVLPNVALRTAQGAVIDFSLFDGNEHRLSNLLRDFAHLRDPITEFLAADEDDPEAVGRLKNVLEGAAIGSAVEGLVMVLRGTRAARNVRQAGGSADEARDAARSAVGDEGALGKVQDARGETWGGMGADDLNTRALDAPFLLATKSSSLTLPVGVLRDPDRLAFTQQAGKGVLAGDIVNLRTRENLRMTPDELESLKSSIEEKGLQDAVTIDVDAAGKITVTDGTHRLLAMSELGANDVRVQVSSRTLDDPASRAKLHELIQEFHGPARGNASTALVRVVNGALDVPRDPAGVRPKKAGTASAEDLAKLLDLDDEMTARWRQLADVSELVHPEQREEFIRALFAVPRFRLQNLGGQGDTVTEMLKFAEVLSNVFRGLPDNVVHKTFGIQAIEGVDAVMNRLADIIGNGPDVQSLVGRLHGLIPPGKGRDPVLKGLVGVSEQALKATEEVRALGNGLLGAYRMLGQSAQELRRMANNPNTNSDSVIIDLAETVEAMFQMSGFLNGTRSESGRILAGWSARAAKGRANGLLDAALAKEYNRAKAELFNGQDPRKFVDAVGEVLDGAVRPEDAAGGIMKLARVSLGRRFGNVLTGTFIQSILSGTKTHVINFVMPMIASATRSVEMVAGGAVLGNFGRAEQGLRELAVMVTSFREALGGARKTFKARRPTLFPNAPAKLDPALPGAAELHNLERQRKLGRPDIGPVSPEQLLGLPAETNWFTKLLSRLSVVVDLPGTVIATTDEVVRGMTARMVMRSELYRTALRDGGLSRAGAAEFVEEAMERLVYNHEVFSWNTVKQRARDVAAREGFVGRGADMREGRLAEEMFEVDREFLEPIIDVAKQRGDEITFTTQLKEDTLGRRFQDMVATVPILRFAIPFVRTPTNLLIYARRRADVIGPGVWLMTRPLPKKLGLRITGYFQNQFLQDVTGTAGKTGRELLHAQDLQADAVGRVVLGTSFLGTMLVAAQNGTITGAGPPDKERREALKAAGWQPYSVRVGDTYLSYERLDPFASVMGVAADLFNFAQWADTEDESDVTAVAQATISALAGIVKSKSYLTGMQRLSEMLTNPIQGSVTVGRSTLAAWMMPAFVEQFTPTGLPGVQGDEHVREVRSVLDAVIRRTPGMSADLEPRRNLYGEPIVRTRRLGDGGDVSSVQSIWMPVSYTEVSDDLVDLELGALKHGFQPPKPKRGGLDLTQFRSRSGQTAFDRWSQLHGEVKVGGRTIRDALRRLIRSRAYQALPSESLPGLETQRVALVSNMIGRFRDRAFAQTLKEYPDLAAEYRGKSLSRRADTLRGQLATRRPAGLNALFGAALGPDLGVR